MPQAEECAWRQAAQLLRNMDSPAEGSSVHHSLLPVAAVTSNATIADTPHEWQSTLIDSIHLLLLSSFHSSVFACDCLLEKLHWG